MKSVTRIIVIVTAAFFFGASFLNVSEAQKRSRTFSHNTKAHREGKYKDCSSCHTLPTKNWVLTRRDGKQPYPDVRNFPYNKHTTCNNCHAKDVYSDGGVFCGSCHVVPSMRATGGKGVLIFPNKSHSTQFTTIFPHDVHQDIIAANRPKRDYSVVHFVPAMFNVPDDKPKPTYYNCAICHKETQQMPKYEMRKPFGVTIVAPPIAGTDADANKFTTENPMKPSFFKTSPDGHETCFTCHYQFQNLPIGKKDCSGCHALTKPYFEKDVIRRYSLRFNHDRDGHTGDCTSCHIRITQSDDLKKKNAEGTPIVADVPIVTCKKCHQTGESVAFKQIISSEIQSREVSAKEKKAAFQCVYCHTSPIAKYDIPASHRNP
ncbi:hypothetical protein BH10ACI3_BH10ACI3_13890 [soil metagenome]